MNAEKRAALSRTCERAVALLPDSISERKAVLHDLLALTPAPSTLRAKIQELLLHLHEHEAAQLKFIALLEPKSNGEGNGGGNGGPR